MSVIKYGMLNCYLRIGSAVEFKKNLLTLLLFLFCGGGFFFPYACSGKSEKDVLELNANSTFLFVKATICSTLANLEGEESFEALMLGQAEEVIQERICDDELILIKK